MMDTVDVRARGVSADALDALRPLARSRGFTHTNNDVVRFAVLLAAEAARSDAGLAMAAIVTKQPTNPRRNAAAGPLYPFD